MKYQLIKFQKGAVHALIRVSDGMFVATCQNNRVLVGENQNNVAMHLFVDPAHAMRYLRDEVAGANAEIEEVDGDPILVDPNGFNPGRRPM